MGAGALIGGGMDVAGQLALNGGNFGQIDWLSVGVSAVSGAISGGVGGAAKAMGKTAIQTLGQVVGWGAFAGAAEYTAYSLVSGNTPTLEGAFLSAAMGGAAAGISYGAGRLIGKAWGKLGLGDKFSESFAKWLNKGDADYTVYQGMMGDNPVYTGITKQSLADRLYQHN